VKKLVKQIILTGPQNVDIFSGGFFQKCSIGSNLFGIKKIPYIQRKRLYVSVFERERERGSMYSVLMRESVCVVFL